MTEQAAAVLDYYRADPLAWFRDVLGCEPWSGQVEIAESVRDHEETAVKSCNSLGKDWLSARIALWFLYCHKPSLVITTAPTERQVKGILWQELASAHANARMPLGGEVFKQELQASPDQRAFGFTATDATKFHGFHCPHILVIADEAAGISHDIYVGIDACLASGAKVRRLEIGNPTDPSSAFADSFKTAGINKLSYSAFDTPNFTAFGITERDMIEHRWREKITGDLPSPYLVTPEWVAKRLDRWGRSNPFYLSRVAAQFPAEGEDTLISMAQIEAAQRRSLEPGWPNVLGFDAARFGDDFNVICHRRGPVVRTIQKWGKCDTMTSTGHVIQAHTRLKTEQIHADVVGLGAGVVDRLKEQGYRVVESSAGSQSARPDEYANRRAEWYWNLRTAFENEEIDLTAEDEDLAAELSDIKWKPDSKGRVTIEPKENMKKRTNGKSPDTADACAQTFEEPSRLKAPMPETGRERQTKSLFEGRKKGMWR
jgi:hypothetical protein